MLLINGGISMLKHTILIISFLMLSSCIMSPKKLTPDEEKVNVVYYNKGDQKLFKELNISEIPSEFKSCQYLGEIDEIRFSGGHQFKKLIGDYIENEFKIKGAKLKANYVLVTKRTDISRRDGYSGGVSAKAFNCSTSYCKFVTNCNIKEYDYENDFAN